MYAVSVFTKDKRPHMTSIHVLEQPQTKALSTPRNETAPIPGQALGRRQDPDTAARGVTTESDSELSPPQGRGTETTIARDPLVVEAERVATERPDLEIAIGTDQNGDPLTVSARQFLEDARATAEEARGDIRLLEVAAACLLGAN